PGVQELGASRAPVGSGSSKDSVRPHESEAPSGLERPPPEPKATGSNPVSRAPKLPISPEHFRASSGASSFRPLRVDLPLFFHRRGPPREGSGVPAPVVAGARAGDAARRAD